MTSTQGGGVSRMWTHVDGGGVGVLWTSTTPHIINDVIINFLDGATMLQNRRNNALLLLLCY